MKEALIYTRVSSTRQKLEGHGLDGQEVDGLRYIHSMEYKYIATFGNDAVSGKTLERGGLDEMFKFIEVTDKEYVIVIPDLKRWARDVEVHRKLKRKVISHGCTLECPTFRFEDTPEGQFNETIIVASGELEREQNKRQVRLRQEARLLKGYWPFGMLPPGYTFIIHPIHGKLMSPIEPLASIVREALEGFANDRFLEQKDVQIFLESKGFYSGKKIGKKVYLEQVKYILTEIKYAGYVKLDKWNIPHIHGHHEALISYETYLKIQEKLARKAKTKYTRGIRDKDFPLRGFIFCSVCKKKLTASWCKGRHAKYPKYRCNNSSCPQYAIGIEKHDIEAKFVEIIERLTPKNNAKALYKAIAIDILKKQKAGLIKRHKDIQNGIKRLNRNIEVLTERITLTRNDDVRQVFENEIEKSVKQGKLLQKQAEILSFDTFSESQYLDICGKIIESPTLTWNEEDHNIKLLVPRLIFGTSLEYKKEDGFTVYKVNPLFEIENV